MSKHQDFFALLIDDAHFLPDFFKAFSKEEIDLELLQPFVINQEEPLQKQRIKNLLSRFCALKEYDRSNFYGKILKTPPIQERMLECLVANTDYTYLLNNEKASWLNEFCQDVFSNACQASPEQKLKFLILLPVTLLKKYYPQVSPWLATDNHLKDNLMRGIFKFQSKARAFLDFLKKEEKIELFLDFLKWIHKNKDSWFEKRSPCSFYGDYSSNLFPEDKIVALTASFTQTDRNLLANQYDQLDNPDFKEWVNDTPVLVDFFEDLSQEPIRDPHRVF